MPHDAPDQRASSSEGAERAVVPTSTTNKGALPNDAHLTSDIPTLQSAGTSPPSIPEHELLRRIGEGSYGEVWLARNRMGSYRAVKIVHRRTFEHDRPFEREYAGIQKFEPISRSHEGFVDLLQIGRNDQEGYFYYVMELADDATENPKSGIRNPKEAQNPNDETGSPIAALRSSDLGFPSAFVIRHSTFYSPRTLKHDLICRGRLPFEDCVQIGLALASALAHLHKNGLVHRDIKPSNIIFVGDVPKLADVGLVAPVGEARSYVGTEGFIPPEGPGSPQADLYSLGIVLYVMSTGKSHTDFPEPLPDLGADPDHARWLEFKAVIHKACQAQVSERYRSAEEMGAELALLHHGQSVKRNRVRERRRAIVGKVGLAIAAVAVLAVALFFVKPFKHEKPLNPEAVRLYELGRWHLNKLTAEDHKKAVDYLNQAVQIEPNYTNAYTMLFEIYSWGMAGDMSGICRQLADKLMMLDPNLAEAHTALSYSEFLAGNWRGAEEEIKQAIHLNENYSTAHGIYCFYLALLGRWEEAMPHVERIQESDPTSRAQIMVGSYPFITARQYEKALTQLNRVVGLDKNFPAAHLFIGRVYEAQSKILEAIEEFKTYDLLMGKYPTDVSERYEALRQAYGKGGERDYWSKLLEFLQADEKVAKEERVFYPADRWPLGGVYARLEDKEKAIEWLEADSEDGRNIWLKFEPLYDSLREERRFKALVKKAGLEQ